MKATVIGANGYIARNLIYMLNKDTRFDEFFLYDKDDVQKEGMGYYERIDILSKESVSSINYDVDVVFMFIGKTGSADGFDNPDVFIDINERALLYVLNEYVSQKSNAKIIFPSTRLLYDHNSNAIEKDVSYRLNTVYAVNKLACEKYIELYHNIFELRYAIARICIPYGTIVSGASSYGTVEFMLSKAEKGENISLYGDGSPRRTLTYIGDLCRAILDIAASDDCKNDIYNIGGEDYSLFEMADVISKSRGVDVDFVDYPEIASKIESGDTVFNDDKLKGLIGDYQHMKFRDWVEQRNEAYR